MSATVYARGRASQLCERMRLLLAVPLRNKAASRNLSTEAGMRLYGWGAGDSGALGHPYQTDAVCEPSEIALSGSAVDIACGWSHSLVVIKKGTNATALQVAGNNGRGQLGLEGIKMTRSFVDVPFFAGKRMTCVAAGREHSAVVTDDGVYTFGASTLGQCGRPPLAAHDMHDIRGDWQPYKLPFDAGSVASVVCGMDHTLVLTRDGRLHAMGWAADGQSGQGVTADTREPTLVAAFRETKVTAVSSRVDCSLAITEHGDVFAWGNSEYGQTMLGKSVDKYTLPVRIEGLAGRGIVAVAAGGSFSLALSASGDVYVGGYGAMGLGKDVRETGGPVRIDALSGERVRMIACGSDHAVAVTADGRVFTFGSGIWGRLGHGSQSDQSEPRQVALADRIRRVSVGVDHVLALAE